MLIALATSSSSRHVCHVGTHCFSSSVQHTARIYNASTRAKVWTSAVVYPLACDYDLGDGGGGVFAIFGTGNGLGSGFAVQLAQAAQTSTQWPQYHLMISLPLVCFLIPGSLVSLVWFACSAAPKFVHACVFADVVQLSQQWLFVGCFTLWLTQGRSE